MATDATTEDSIDLVDETPRVHSIFVPSTQTWQYVVADPSTSHCLVIDPVRDRVQSSTEVCMAAAEMIISLVKELNYTVDYICETASSSRNHLSAAWFLRMQFAYMQGHAPQLSNDATVAALEDTWRKRHGTSASMPTRLRAGLANGETFHAGQMPVECLHLPSPRALGRRAFLIRGSVFGAHSLVMLTSLQDSCITPSPDAVEESQRPPVLESVQRVMSLPANTLVYKDQGDEDLPGEHPFDQLGYWREQKSRADLTTEDVIARLSQAHQSQELHDQQSGAVESKAKRLKARFRRSWKARHVPVAD